MSDKTKEQFQELFDLLDSFCLRVEGSYKNIETMQKKLKEFRKLSGLTADELGRQLLKYENISKASSKDMANPARLVTNIENETGLSPERTLALFNLLYTRARVLEENDSSLISALCDNFYFDCYEGRIFAPGEVNKDESFGLLLFENRENLIQYIDHLSIKSLPTVTFGKDSIKKEKHLLLLNTEQTNRFTIGLRLFRLLLNYSEEDFASELDLSKKGLNPYEVGKEKYHLSQYQCYLMVKLIIEYVKENIESDITSMELICLLQMVLYPSFPVYEKRYADLVKEYAYVLQYRDELRQSTKEFYHSEIMNLLENMRSQK